MNCEKEFNSQWQTFLNLVETRVRREMKASGRFDLTAANAILQSEAAKWSDPSHYNGAWLHKLWRLDTALSEEFQTRLATLQVAPPDAPRRRFPVWPVLLSLGVVATTFFALRWYQLSLLKQLIGTGAVAAMNLSALQSYAGQRKGREADVAVQALREQLQGAGEGLRALAVRADRDARLSASA
ncbi:MAG: hypothetical protein ACREEM_00320 [Blastocatellia bacterium]